MKMRTVKQIIGLACFFFVFHMLMVERSPRRPLSMLLREQQSDKQSDKQLTFPCIGDRQQIFAGNKQLEKGFEGAYEILEQHATQFAVHAGTMLHLYRDCGLSSDTSDIDFLVPVEDVFELIDVFTLRGWRLYRKFGTPDQPGYEISFKTSGVRYHVDIFSFNVDTEENFWPLWTGGKLRRCALSKDIDFGYKIKVGERMFNAIGPPEKVLETIYTKDWDKPIASRNWNWINPYCKFA